MSVLLRELGDFSLHPQGGSAANPERIVIGGGGPAVGREGDVGRALRAAFRAVLGPHIAVARLQVQRLRRRATSGTCGCGEASLEGQLGLSVTFDARSMNSGATQIE